MEEKSYQLSLPKWFESLPINWRPWKRETINKLENILREIKEDTNNFFPEEAFSFAIGNSYATSKRVQIFIYHQNLGLFFIHHRNFEKKEILKLALLSRVESGKFAIEAMDIPEVKIAYRNINLDEVMKKINSLKDLCDFIEEREKFIGYSLLPDLFRLREFREKIDNALNEEIGAYFQGNLCPRFQRMDINLLHPVDSFIKFSKKVFNYLTDIDPNIPPWIAIQSLIQTQFPQISSDVAYLIALKYEENINRLCEFLYWGLGVEEYKYKEKGESLDDKRALELLNNSHLNLILRAKEYF